MFLYIHSSPPRSWITFSLSCNCRHYCYYSPVVDVDPASCCAPATDHRESSTGTRTLSWAPSVAAVVGLAVVAAAAASPSTASPSFEGWDASAVGHFRPRWSAASSSSGSWSDDLCFRRFDLWFVPWKWSGKVSNGKGILCSKLLTWITESKMIDKLCIHESN